MHPHASPLSCLGRGHIINSCKALLDAYRTGLLGSVDLPEDNSPAFGCTPNEAHLSYFTLPMSLNYRRNSSQLWQAALRTYEDEETCGAFDVGLVSGLSVDELRGMLTKYKVALQPTRHVLNWHTIAKSVDSTWGTFTNLLRDSDHDFLKLRALIQGANKSAFPYLAGPKLFNYWCFILESRCGIAFKNSQFIDIAVDVHVTRSSIMLGVISEREATQSSPTQIAARWRELLEDSSIAPVDLNIPLWLWSRAGFVFQPQTGAVTACRLDDDQ